MDAYTVLNAHVALASVLETPTVSGTLICTAVSQTLSLLKQIRPTWTPACKIRNTYLIIIYTYIHVNPCTQPLEHVHCTVVM